MFGKGCVETKGAPKRIDAPNEASKRLRVLYIEMKGAPKKQDTYAIAYAEHEDRNKMIYT